MIARPGRVLIRDEIDYVRRYAEQLKGEGVDIIIGLGHSGYGKDKELAAKVPNLDLVIGGHSHSFLYPESKAPPSGEKPVGPYPTYVTQPRTGRKVPVVQAYAFTKYLGYLEIEFDDQGELISLSGDPVLLDSKWPQSKFLLHLLSCW